MRRAACIVVALAACHGGKGRKSADAELDRAMRETLARWPVEHIDCPPDHAVAPGAQFDCLVTFRGGLVDPAHVEIRPDTVWVKLERAVTTGPDLAVALAKAKSAQLGHLVDVDCGPDVVATLGAVCTLTDGGTPAGLVRVQAKGGAAANVPADSVAAERHLRFAEEHALGPVDAVTCTPAGELKVGDHLSCDLRMVGGAHTVAHYALGPDDAPDATFTFDPPLVDPEQLAADLASAIAGSPHVDCGTGIVAQGPDGIVCTYSDRTGRHRLRVTRDPAGHNHTEELPST